MKHSSFAKPSRLPDTGAAQLLARAGDLEGLKAHAAAGLPLDEPDAQGDTALLYAVFSCHRDTWHWLLDQGVNILHANHKGDTVLHHMSRRFKSRQREEDDPLDDFRELIRRGADVNARNKEGVTPILMEAMRGTEFSTSPGKRPRMAHMQILCELGADLVTPAYDGRTVPEFIGADGYQLIVAQREARTPKAPEPRPEGEGPRPRIRRRT